jgi:hypothetical protein
MQRRRFFRAVAIASFAIAMVGGFAGLARAAAKLWECNFCHQQYQGDNPPRFVKCPAKDMKQNHWWIQKH